MMKNSNTVSLLVGLFMLSYSDTYAGCLDLPQPQARQALQILSTQDMIVEYCEKCSDNIHQIIGIRSTGIVCDNKNMCRILINGQEADMSRLFAQNADGKDENIAYAIHCPDALLYNPRFLDFNK